MHRLLALVAVITAACGGPPLPAPAPPVVPAPRSAPVLPPVAAQAAPTEPPPAAPTRVVPADAIAVRVRPTPAYVEVAAHGQLVNCDLEVTSRAGVALTLVRLEVSVFDRAGALVLRKFLDDNGVSPSILTVPSREIPAGGTVLVLNPLFQFPADAELGRLRFELTYTPADSEQRIVAVTEVAPEVYVDHARLQLPLRGRVLVWDGHDFLAHHRRWDYVFAPIQALGFTSNMGRYSYDLVIVDAAGAMVQGDPAVNTSWLGFGRPIHAPAAGTVVTVVDAHPDDRTLDMAAIPTNQLAVFGNYIVIDHGHGEHSVLGHLRQHSATVRAGERVIAGQVIATVGASGSSLMPHLHYQLQRGPTAAAEGLPSYFERVRRVRGGRVGAAGRAQIDSGDIVESAAR